MKLILVVAVVVAVVILGFAVLPVLWRHIFHFKDRGVTAAKPRDTNGPVGLFWVGRLAWMLCYFSICSRKLGNCFLDNVFFLMTGLNS